MLDHDPKLTSEVFRAFVKGMGSSHIVGSAYHKNTSALLHIGDTVRAFANGRKGDWDQPCSPSTTRPAPASTLGNWLTLFTIDLGSHTRLPHSAPPADGTRG